MVSPPAMTSVFVKPVKIPNPIEMKILLSLLQQGFSKLNEKISPFSKRHSDATAKDKDFVLFQPQLFSNHSFLRTVKDGFLCTGNGRMYYANLLWWNIIVL